MTCLHWLKMKPHSCDIPVSRHLVEYNSPYLTQFKDSLPRAAAAQAHCKDECRSRLPHLLGLFCSSNSAVIWNTGSVLCPRRPWTYHTSSCSAVHSSPEVILQKWRYGGQDVTFTVLLQTWHLSILLFSQYFHCFILRHRIASATSVANTYSISTRVKDFFAIKEADLRYFNVWLCP